RLEEEMAAAAANQAFERAAALRDRAQPIRWLLTKLAQLQQVRTEYSFLYPVTGPGGAVIWYIIHGGRTVAVTPKPGNAAEARAVARMLQRIYVKDCGPTTLESYEHIDGMLLVASWFRRFPKERGKVLLPEDALQQWQR